MTDPSDLLAVGAAEVLGRPLTAEEAGQFHKYLNLLIKWQGSVRLVGRATPTWIVENLLLDSLLFLRALPSHFESVLDLGAGAGLPGVPIKIVKPDISLALIEARRRRASFLSTVVRELQLPGVQVINARGEDVAPSPEFDAVVMRCAGDTERMIPLATRFISRGGRVVVSGPPVRRVGLVAEAGWVETPGISVVRSGAPRQFRVVQVPM